MFIKYFLMAYEALLVNKVRSFLTTLGIIIGVFSVIVMIGFGQGSQALITEKIKGLGANVLIITPGSPKTKATGHPGNIANSLTLDDSKSLEVLPGVVYVSPNAVTQTLMEFEKNSEFVSVIGTSQYLQNINGLEMGEGRFFNEQEGRNASKVVVLGYKLADNLFKKTLQNALNNKVKIDNNRYRVIGILKEQGSSLFGSADDQAVMPTKTFQQTLKGGKRLDSIMMKITTEELVPIVQEQIKTILRHRHGIRPDEEEDFKIQTQAELLDTVTVITRVFTFLLAGIAAISLLVGGIGIMNIMLVSVTERTREIGIRKAIGAKRKDILIQFLIEAASISLFGGTIGIILGLLVTKVVTKLVNIPFVASPVAIIGAFIFSVTVGIFFGLYPANKASKLDPVEALRYE